MTTASILDEARGEGARGQSDGVERANPPSKAADDAARVLEAAVAILGQGEAFLAAINEAAYSAKVPVAFNASMGGHYRHCLDHFASVLRGLEGSLVDYDRRERDLRIERDPGFALEMTRAARARLERLDPGALLAPVGCRCEVSYDHGISPATDSSLARELVYTIAHAIHHFALISVMARLSGVDLPEHFGIAPSTVTHLRQQAG
jgi:hypothetical protein